MVKWTDHAKTQLRHIHDYIAQDSNNVNDTIQKGVKETYKSESTKSISLRWAIQNGVKETKSTIMSQDSKIEGTIQNGVKEIQPLPTQDGNRDWGKYYHGKEDRTKPHTEYVDGVIENGVKETNWRRVDNFPEFEERVINGGTKI